MQIERPSNPPARSSLLLPLAIGGIVALIGGYAVSEYRMDARERLETDRATVAVEAAERDVEQAEQALDDVMAGDPTGLSRMPTPSVRPPDDMLLLMRQAAEQGELLCSQGIAEACSTARLQRRHYEELRALPR